MHFIHYAYTHLVGLGVYRDLTAAIIGALVARLVAELPLRKHRQKQQEIVDLLNTHSPGGLADVVQELEVVEAKQDAAAEIAAGKDGL
jgi:hypothetical protein